MSKDLHILMMGNWDALMGFMDAHSAMSYVPVLKHGDKVFMVEGYGYCLATDELEVVLVEVSPYGKPEVAKDDVTAKGGEVE